MIRKYLIKNNSYFILVCYVMLFGRMLSLTYQIDKFNYFILLLLYFAGISVHLLYKRILKKFSVKLVFTIILISSFTLYVIKIFRSISVFINRYFIKSYNSINSAILKFNHTSFNNFLPFLIILIPAFILSYLFLRKLYPVLSIILTFIFMYLFWFNGCDIKKYVVLYVVLSIMDFCLGTYSFYHKRADKNGFTFHVKKENILIYSSLIAVTAILFSMLCTDIFGVKSISEIMDEREEKRIQQKVNASKYSFNISYSGYSDSSASLGGPVNLNYKLAMKVKSDKPLYLRGSIKDFYDGHSWKLLGGNYFDYFNSDYLKQRILSTDINKSGQVKKVEIYPGVVSSSTIFAPLNSFNVFLTKGKIKCNQDYSFMYVSNNVVNLSYTVEYIDGLKGNKGFEVSGNEYNNIKEKYSEYLQLPGNITPETYKLVDEITKGCTNSKEKVDKIQSYLSEHYPYSLNVSKVPGDREFVDYFLFTEKKGYCTYFATAAAVLCRIAGVPARYVEGFYMSDLKDSNGLYVVTNSRAHAWVEVLASTENNLWETVDCKPIPLNDDTQPENYVGQQGGKNSADSADEGINTVTQEDNKTSADKGFNISHYILFLLFSILIIMIIFICFKVGKFNRSFEKLVGSSKFSPLYLFTFERLKSIGIEFKPSRPLMEAVKDMEDTELKKRLIEATEAYYNELYGENMNLQYDKARYVMFIEKYIKNKSNIIKYYYNKYFK